MEEVKIVTEYIKLDQFIKFLGLVQSGGEAQMIIEDEMVLVNGEICTMRGKKLRRGDIIEIKGLKDYIVI